MLLRRNGNKSKLAHLITPHFPEHKIYIEPCFGAGGMYFNKPKAKYNFLNDLDDDVFNLFMVVKNQRDELYAEIQRMPIHQSLMKHWQHNKETSDLWRAIRFLFLSNFSYMSKGNMLRFTADNSREILLSRIEPTFHYMKEATFMNVDFRDVLPKISFQDKIDLCKKSDSFIYFDGPYFKRGGWYSDRQNNAKAITESFDMLVDSGIRFAMSEFNNPVVMDLAIQRNLNVITIGERRNLKNRETEILITNYAKPRQMKLFTGLH